MNTSEIQTLLTALFNQHGICTSIDQLPMDNHFPLLVVFNTSTSNIDYGHWIAAIIHKENGYLFDSFAQEPDSKVANWLSRHCSINWSFNTRVVQSYLTESCGLYCIYFLYYALLLYPNVSWHDIMTVLFPPTLTIDEYECIVYQFINTLLIE